MEWIILTSLALALTALPSVEGQTCAITQSNIVVGEPYNFQDPSQYKYMLRGISKGSLPTSSTWRREGAVLCSTSPYSIAGLNETTSGNPCSDRFSESQLTVTGKITGEFTYTVRNEDTDSDVVGTLTIEAADNPSNLMLRQNGRFTVEISWTLSATPPSNGYTLSIGSDPFNGTTITNPHTYMPSTMQVGELITVHLVAASKHFFSDVLGPVSITLRDLLDPIVTSSSVTATSATLVLAQPMDSLPADQYTVTLTRRTGGLQSECPNFADSAIMTSSSDSVLLEGLQESSVYTVSITAKIFELTRSISEADITTLTAVPEAAPRDFQFDTVTSTSITLTWRNIDCIQHNGLITSFLIRYGKVAGALTTMTIGSSDNTSYNVEGLLPYIEYRFQIAGINVNGTGPYTAFIGPIRTDENVPGAVTGLTGNVKFYSLELSWLPPQMPNGVLTGYNIMYTVNGSSSRTAQMTATSKPQYTITELQPQTTISNITITASTRIGVGEPTQFSNVFITHSEPPMVTNVVVTVLTDTSVRISWERLLISEITQYIIIYQLTENRKRQATKGYIEVPSTENSVDIAALITGSEYQFQVVAQAEVEGEIKMGASSLLTTVSVRQVSFVALPHSTKQPTQIAITAVVVVILTVVLYSIILTLVLVVLHHRNHNSRPQETTRHNEDVNSKQVMELKECQAYGQASAMKWKECRAYGQASAMELKECRAYGQVSAMKLKECRAYGRQVSASGRTSQGVPPATIEHEGVYNYI